jgi:hypothetical protein
MLLPALNTFAVLHTLNSRIGTSAEVQNCVQDHKSTAADSLTDGCQHLEPRQPCPFCNGTSTDNLEATSAHATGLSETISAPVFTLAGVNVRVDQEIKSECEKDYEAGHRDCSI